MTRLLPGAVHFPYIACPCVTRQRALHLRLSIPARLGVLRQAGTDSVVQVSGLDGDAIQAVPPDVSHHDLVTVPAEVKAKAVAVSTEHKDAVVVVCDSMLSTGGEILGSPDIQERAKERWTLMAGNHSEPLTGYAVILPKDGKAEQQDSGWESTTVRSGSTGRPRPAGRLHRQRRAAAVPPAVLRDRSC